MGSIRNAHEILLGKPEEKIPIGKPRRIREDDVQRDFKEIICMNRIYPLFFCIVFFFRLNTTLSKSHSYLLCIMV
jgi:hypothetical protein